MWCQLHDPTFSSFSKTPTYDRLTDTQIHNDSIYCDKQRTAYLVKARFYLPHTIQTDTAITLQIPPGLGVDGAPDAHNFWLGQPWHADTLPADLLWVPGQAATDIHSIISTVFV